MEGKTKPPIPNSLEELIATQETELPHVPLSGAINRFLEVKAREKGIPLHGTFELTPLCNLDCKMCYVHLTKEQMGDRKLLTVDQWKSLIKQAVDAGMMYATLTGGECLTYPEFDEVYLYLISFGVRVTILTNALLLNEERIQFFKKYPPKGFQISFYGSSQDEYEEVTGVRAFETILQNIRKCQEAGFLISLAITPNRFLRNCGKDLIRFVESLGIDYNINTCLFTPREETGRAQNSIDLTIEEYVELHKYRLSLRGVLLEPNSCQMPIPKQAGTNIKGLQCSAGVSGFDISWDGTMTPCSSIRDIVTTPLVHGFRSCWEIIRKAVREYPLPSECQNCDYSKFCPQCVAAHQIDAPKGHASKWFCKRVQAFVAAGLISYDDIGGNKNEKDV